MADSRRPNQRTMAFYASNAESYAKHSPSPGFTEQRSGFAAQLLPGASVLDFGCGGGHDSLALINQGFSVTSFDGSRELASIAQKRTGRTVIVADFLDLSFTNEFDAVWAAASLLHAPSGKLTQVFAKVARSLRPGGVFKASFKEASHDWTDDLGRYFCAMDGPRLAKLLQASDFEAVTIETHPGTGSDGQATQWIWGTGILREK